MGQTAAPGYERGREEALRGHAVFDASARYRYALRREWAPGRRVAFVMLNPSRADAALDDPTIRRCIGFATAWGYGSLEVVNLYALRTPDPRELRRAADPVGPDNDRHIRRAAARADLVVCAWGAPAWAADRAAAVADLLPRRRLACLGLTVGGAPRHPLYLAGSARPRAFAG